MEISFRVHVQVWLCFCLGLPSCFSICGCQQNASAPCHRLSLQPSSSSSSSSSLGPPFSRAETPLPAGRALLEHFPGWGTLQGQDGCRESPGKPVELDAGWTRAAGCSGWSPRVWLLAILLPLQWGGFWVRTRGVPRCLAVTLTPRAAGKVLHDGGNWENPYSPWKSNSLRQDCSWDLDAWMCTRDSGLEWLWTAPSRGLIFFGWWSPKMRCEQKEFKPKWRYFLGHLQEMCSEGWATSGRYYALHVYVGFDFGGSVLKDMGFLQLLLSCRDRGAKVEV